MPATYEPIASQTLGSDASTVTFSDIPGTYTDLVLVTVATVSTPRSLRYRLNGDTGTNYSTTFLAGYGSTVASSRDSSVTSFVGALVYNGMSTTTPTVSTLQVMSYANTNVFKTALEAGGFATTEVNRHVSLWRSTAAVTSLTVLLNGAGDLKSGSTFSLYGIKAA